MWYARPAVVATFGGRRKEDDDDDDEGSRSAPSSGDAQSKRDPVPKRFGNEARRAFTASVACLALAHSQKLLEFVMS